MMPRLAAEEALASAEATALGSGTLARADARRLTAALQRRAQGGKVGRRPRKGGTPDPAALAAVGIGVTVVDRKA